MEATGESGSWGTLRCGCGRYVVIHYEVVSGYDETQTVFRGECSCGRKGSGFCPEQVHKMLTKED